jgi:hypothetical protein
MFVELYSIVGRPNVLSYGELRTATENFSSNNLLGEGGYGSVYKVSPSAAYKDMNLLNLLLKVVFLICAKLKDVPLFVKFSLSCKIG